MSEKDHDWSRFKEMRLKYLELKAENKTLEVRFVNINMDDSCESPLNYLQPVD